MTYREEGATLVEVLISMVILAVGLMSLVVLHGRLHLLQVEAYQRSQALVLVEDLASRMYLNRNDVASYVTAAGPIGGTLANCPTATATRAEADLTEWCETLVGASEACDERSEHEYRCAHRLDEIVRRDELVRARRIDFQTRALVKRHFCPDAAQ